MRITESIAADLRALEEGIFVRWKNRIHASISDVVPRLFDTPTIFSFGSRFSYVGRDRSRVSFWRDSQCRSRIPVSSLANVPLGHEYRINVNCRGKLIGCINASFVIDVGNLSGESLWISRLQDMDVIKTKCEREMGVPCYHAFAGVFDPPDLEIPERSVLLNWKPKTEEWNYRPGRGADALWRLFFPRTDEECAKRICECVLANGSNLILTSRVCRACGLNEEQLDFLCRFIPGAKIMVEGDVRVLEMVSR